MTKEPSFRNRLDISEQDAKRQLLLCSHKVAKRMKTRLYYDIVNPPTADFAVRCFTWPMSRLLHFRGGAFD